MDTAAKAVMAALKDAFEPHKAQDKPVLPVAVVVVGCNYARFLGDALESVHRQIPGPSEVVYVDNGSTDDSVSVAKAQGVKAIRLKRQETICAARNTGADNTTAPYLIFMDADDLMPQGYVKGLLDGLMNNGRAAVAYPSYKLFGIRRGSGGAVPYSRDALLRENFIVSCSMIRRDALRSVVGWSTNLPCYQDWDLWLRLGAQGWEMQSVPSVCMDVRTHADSLTAMTLNRAHWYQAILKRQPVTLFCPLGPGRYEIQKRIPATISSLGLDFDNTTIVLYDNAHDQRVSAMCRKFLDRFGSRGAVYFKDDTYVTYHDRESRIAVVPERLAEIWTHGSQFFHGDFIMSLEDDVVPELDGAFGKLFDGMQPDVDAVTGVYHSRITADGWANVLVRDWQTRPDGAMSIVPIRRHAGDLPQPPQDGCTDIGAAGVGCLLLRKEAVKDFRYDTGKPGNWLGQDFGLCRHILDRGRRILAHWGVRCRHYQSAKDYV